MKEGGAIVLLALSAAALSGCAEKPLAQQVFGSGLAVAADATGPETAEIRFSAEAKYESQRGVPLAGDPVICRRDGMFRVKTVEATAATPRIAVKAGEEISVTSVIQWLNAGWQKTCWPFVAFTPESAGRYVVVNERIGGKGASAMWTGVGRQSCAVSVYKETADGVQRIETRKSSSAACQGQH